jgi:hypothetical protein
MEREFLAGIKSDLDSAVVDINEFEGFKSSGYLRLIENKTLLKHLMTLYTVSIPFQEQADASTYKNRQQYYDEHIGPKGAK